MKKYTLLEVVQSTLESMGSDPVDTILETPESSIVASIAQDVFFDMAVKGDWKHLRIATTLTALADATHPNYFSIPDGIEDIQSIKYNIKTDAADPEKFEEIQYIEDPNYFLELVHTRTSTDSNVDTITDFGGASLFIINDAVPSYWTTFGDDYIIFDSYLATLDATMPANKTVLYGTKAPTWTASDAAVPDMPGKMFPAYLERVKAVCHADILKAESSVHTREAISLATSISTKNTITKNPNGTHRAPRYGRK